MEREMLLACDDESGEEETSNGENWNERVSKNCPPYPTDGVGRNQPNALKNLHQYVSTSCRYTCDGCPCSR